MDTDHGRRCTAYRVGNKFVCVRLKFALSSVAVKYKNGSATPRSIKVNSAIKENSLQSSRGHNVII
jgi:hypothetical protein